MSNNLLPPPSAFLAECESPPDADSFGIVGVESFGFALPLPSRARRFGFDFPSEAFVVAAGQGRY